MVTVPSTFYHGVRLIQENENDAKVGKVKRFGGFHPYIGTIPHPVTVTTRIIPFLVGNPYKPSFVTVTAVGGRPNPYMFPQIPSLPL